MNFSTTAKKEKPPKAAFRFLSFPVERIFRILKSKHKGFLNCFDCRLTCLFAVFLFGCKPTKLVQEFGVLSRGGVFGES